MVNVSLSERQLRAIVWALVVLQETNPSAAFPPPEVGCDKTDLIIAKAEISRALRRAGRQAKPPPAGRPLADKSACP